MTSWGVFQLLLLEIKPAHKYPRFVIAAQARIQQSTRYRSKIPSLAGIKPGMTPFDIWPPGQ